MIQKYYNTLFEKGKSSSVIQTINLKLNSFFEYAVNQGYIAKNPTERKKVTIPGLSEKTKKEVETFSDEEITAIKKGAETHNHGMLFLLALGTGLRQGELLGLKWKYVNFDKKTVTVKYTVKYITEITKDGKRKCVNKIYTPKTKESLRTVPIPNSLMPKLKQHRLFEKEKCLENGVKFSDDNFVFTTRICNPINSSNIIRSFQLFLLKNNINTKKFHCLRHANASLLINMGVPVKVISEHLGHCDTRTTENIYAHVFAETLAQTSDAISQALAGVEK